MAKGDKQERIDFIKSYVAKGMSRKQVLSKYVKKWQCSDRTFDRVWKKANEQHSELQQKANEAANRIYIERVEFAAKEAIMGKIERQQILTQIARGEIPLKKPMVVDKEVKQIDITPDWMDRKAAIAELNKMDGDYAPIKKEITGANGNPIEVNNTNINLSKEDIEKLSAVLEDKV